MSPQKQGLSGPRPEDLWSLLPTCHLLLLVRLVWLLALTILPLPTVLEATVSPSCCAFALAFFFASSPNLRIPIWRARCPVCRPARLPTELEGCSLQVRVGPVGPEGEPDHGHVWCAGEFPPVVSRELLPAVENGGERPHACACLRFTRTCSVKSGEVVHKTACKGVRSNRLTCNVAFCD